METSGINISSCFRLDSNMHEAAEKPFACCECNRSFLRYPDLKRHLRFHMNHVCGACGKRFTCDFDLERHLLRIHAEEDPPRKNLSRSSNLKTYLHPTSEKKPVCDESVPREHGEPLVIDACDSSFSEVAALEARVHTGKKRYNICDTCGAGFSQDSAGRAAHLCTHASKKSHSYDVCDTRFSLRSSVRLHVRRSLCKCNKKSQA